MELWGRLPMAVGAPSEQQSLCLPPAEPSDEMQPSEGP